MVYICSLAHISCHLLLCQSNSLQKHFLSRFKLQSFIWDSSWYFVTMTVADIVVRRLLSNQLCLLWTVFALGGQKGFVMLLCYVNNVVISLTSWCLHYLLSRAGFDQSIWIKELNNEPGYGLSLSFVSDCLWIEYSSFLTCKRMDGPKTKNAEI